MAIDKESNGVPEVNVHRRTTKVNLGVIAGIVVFFAVAVGVVVYVARHSP